MDLKTPVGSCGRMYKMYAGRLEKLGISKLEDFLFHLPFRYEDYSLISKIKDIQPGEITTIRGNVTEIKNQYTRGRKIIQKAKIKDETGEIEIIWFNQPYLARTITEGQKVSLSGKIIQNFNKLTMESPDYELIPQNNTEPDTEPHTIHTGRLVPVYPETRGVSSKWLRRQTYKILTEQKQNLSEYLPSSIIKSHELIDYYKALEQIHFPEKIDSIDKARQRLAFDELFLIQLATIIRKTQWKKELKGIKFVYLKYKKQIDSLISGLPFKLTAAQEKSLNEIIYDLSSDKPMNRLLEGDVGSGKTVVSAIAMYLTYLNGYQSVMMAPTEILAHQHYQTILKLLSPLGVKVDLATRSSKYHVSSIKNQKEKTKKIPNTKYKIHNTDILVGTHAVLSEKIKLEKLGLVIIDEQQRFGVEQRAMMRKKGKNPHVLTMTATPIPRTVALTLYGELDLSVLDEMPKDRKNIKTWLIPKEKRKSAYQWITGEINEHQSQVFIVCPFIEESETMVTVKAAVKEFENLKKEVFPNLKLGLLHGKIKAGEKEKVLDDFRNKKIDILVATPVVEVGIDFPNATIMMIEGAERFGLSQLHQLRGRVGRGEKQSYCLLFAESYNPKTTERLKSMETINIGARLAELDLKLRGPGEIYGTKQHGVTILKAASFSDFDLIEKTKKEAEKIFPELNKYPLLLSKITLETIKEVAPD